jgi:hypothetical protein
MLILMNSETAIQKYNLPGDDDDNTENRSWVR